MNNLKRFMKMIIRNLNDNPSKTAQFAKSA